MAWALHVDKLEPGGKISIRHTFFAKTPADCEKLRDEHGAGCRAFGPALEQHKTIEIFEQLDELPEWEDD